MHHQGQWRLCLGRADAGATRSSQGSVHFLWHGPALEEVLGGRSTAPTGRDYIRSPSHVASLGQILGTCMLWNFAKIDGLDAWRMSLLNIILRFTKILSVSSWEARKFVPFSHGIEVVAVQRAWIFWLHFSLSLHLSSAAQELWVPRSST